MQNKLQNLMDQLKLGQALPTSPNVLDPSITADQLAEQSDNPLFVAPDLMPMTEISDVETQQLKNVIPKYPTNEMMQQEADDVANQPEQDIQDLSGPVQPGVVESGKISQTDFDTARGNAAPEAPQSEYEKLQAKMQELRDLEAAQNETATKYNFGAKAAAIIGDALSRYNTGGIQKNAKANIQYTGPKLQELMSIVGEVKAPDQSKNRAELLKEYEMLKKAQGGELTDYQKKSLKLREDALTLAKEKEKGVGERASDNIGLRKDVLEESKTKNRRMSDKQTEIISAYDETLKSLSRTKDLKTGIDTGPLAELQNSLAARIGVDDPKVTALKVQTLDTLAERIKALSGTAASEKEADRLKITLPTLKDSDASFMEKLAQAETRIQEARAIRLGSYGKQGKSTESFQPEEQSAAPSSDPKIEQYAQQHGLDYSKAEQILKARGYNGR